jgi:copper chaperone
MKELKFKTNVNCNHCIAKITPFMNEEKRIVEWSVDIENPDKIMTVKGDEADEQMVKDALAKAGYVGETIDN